MKHKDTKMRKMERCEAFCMERKSVSYFGCCTHFERVAVTIFFCGGTLLLSIISARPNYHRTICTISALRDPAALAVNFFNVLRFFTIFFSARLKESYVCFRLRVKRNKTFVITFCSGERDFTCFN